MARLLFKYDVRSRGKEGRNNTWIIKDLDSEDEFLTDHIEIKVPVSTNERTVDDGFGMYANADVEYRNYPNSEKKFIVLVPERDEDIFAPCFGELKEPYVIECSEKE